MEAKRAPRIFTWPDVAVFGLFVLLATAYALGRGTGFQPFLFLDADAAKLASWAAALDHPELFAGDSSLGDTSDFRYYFTIHLPLLRALTKVTGHYGSSFSALLWPHIVVQLVAFYTLGRVLFGSRLFALLLALVTFPPVSLNLWETWGAMPDALPRITFQALLPFVLAGTLLTLDRPSRWPWILAALGLLMYAHPVSTPAWALAVWGGLWLCHPAGWSTLRRFSTMFGLGLVFLAVAGPFAWIYLTQHEHGFSAEIPVEEIRTIFSALLPPEYFDAGYALRQFIGLWWNAEGLLWVGAALGGGCVWVLRPRDRRAVLVVAAWGVGIAFVSFAVPYVEQTIERAIGAAPVDILLTRNLRYLVPLGLIFCLWGLAAIAGSDRPSSPRRFAAQALATVLVWAWWVPHFPPALTNLVACVQLGALNCQPGSWLEAAEAIEAVRRETPPRARILPTRFAHSVQIRFHALRPVVHSRWDPAVLTMGNHEKLLAWYEVHREQQRIRQLPPPERAPAFLRLADRLGADYVLVDRSHRPEDFPLEGALAPAHRLVWRNRSFALVDLDVTAPSDTELEPEIQQPRGGAGRVPGSDTDRRTGSRRSEVE
jgi:hypothetical protein